MKKSILMLSVLAVLMITCNKNSKATEDKKTSIDSTSVNNIRTEAYEGNCKDKIGDEYIDVYKKLLLHRKKGSKSGNYDCIYYYGAKSKVGHREFSGSFTEIKGIIKDGRKLGDVVYKLVTSTTGSISYYTIREGELFDVNADMIAADGN